MERNIKGCELAKETNITSAYLSLIEKGREPSRKVKKQLARALGLPMKALWN